MIRRHSASVVLAIAAVVLLAAMANAVRAHALTPPPEGWGTAYMNAALDYWDVTDAPNCDTTSISFDDPAPLAFTTAQRPRPVLGRATVTTGAHERCFMQIAPLTGMGIYFRCVLFAHEFGHWLGVPDSPTDDPRSVRAELLGAYTHDAPCAELLARTR